jgi:glycosyltransferase involved in cell wall biosynthesis
MRFLMLNWRDPKNPKAGGAERVTEGYWSALQKRGHEVYWFTNDFPGASPEEVINRIHIVRGGGRGESVVKARHWYRQQKPFDLVVDQHHGIPWFAPWWAHANCVAYVHEVLGPIWGAFYPWPISMFGRWQERWVHRLYRNVPFWTGSESTKRGLHRHGIPDVTVIHYGINLKPLSELEPKSIEQPVRLIAVSRLAPNKRISHAIEATRLLLARGIETELTIVGTGEEEAKLKEQAAKAGLTRRVTFTGLLSEPDKDAHLRRSHLLVHTSLREGWGLNVLEANAMGTPAIVYPVDGLVDAVIHDETGIVTREENPASIADGIAGLLKAPQKYQPFRVKGCERTKMFHWDNVLPEACAWLERMAAVKRQTNRS